MEVTTTPFMDHRSNRPHDGCVASNSRGVGKRAAVARMLAENREGLGMKVIAIMVQRYGVLPRDMWDLNSISDMGAERVTTFDKNVSKASFQSIINNNRYSIVNITIGKGVSHQVVQLPSTLRHLKVMANLFNYQADLPSSLEELYFDRDCSHNLPVVLPSKLRKLQIGDGYNLPIILPSGLIELSLGSAYDHPLNPLPQRLERLVFTWNSRFNRPLLLPPSLRIIQFGDSYNQPTILPSGIVELWVGRNFTRELLLPNSLRKIDWWCNRPIQIPEGVLEVVIHGDFSHPLVLPVGLKKFTFEVRTYPHPMNLPTGLQELIWLPREYEGLVLPEGLQKLTWRSTRNVTLPLRLRELVLRANALLDLPQELVKVTFDCKSSYHYNLPESVQEVVVAGDVTFSHMSTLHHLVIEYSQDELDLFYVRVHKLTISDSYTNIKVWPYELEELEFTVDDMKYPLRVPKGVKIVGDKRPANVTLE